MFHLLDITLWNAFYICRLNRPKLIFIQFREEIIKCYLGVANIKDGRDLVKAGPIHGGRRSAEERDAPATSSSQSMHFMDHISNPKYPNRNYHLRCRNCASKAIRKETKYLCKTCPNKPPLCVVYFWFDGICRRCPRLSNIFCVGTRRRTLVPFNKNPENNRKNNSGNLKK